MANARMCTVKGRVVYNRKKHVPKPKDGKRLLVASFKYYDNAVTLSADFYPVMAEIWLAFLETALELSAVEVGEAIRKGLVNLFGIAGTIDEGATASTIRSLASAFDR